MLFQQEEALSQLELDFFQLFHHPIDAAHKLLVIVFLELNLNWRYIAFLEDEGHIVFGR